MIERSRNGSGTIAEERGQPMGLIGYLAQLGLPDADLAKAISLLPMPDVTGDSAKAVEREGFPQGFPQGSPQGFPMGSPMESPSLPARRRFETKKTVSAKRAVRLFMAEEQQILREAYLAFFTDQPGIELTGVTDDTSAESLIDAVTASEADVLLLRVHSVHD